MPSGPAWIHEVKHDGYHLIVQRAGKRVRLSLATADWSDDGDDIRKLPLNA